MRRRIQGGWSRCEDSRGCRESSVPGTASANVVLRPRLLPIRGHAPPPLSHLLPAFPTGKAGAGSEPGASSLPALPQQGGPLRPQLPRLLVKEHHPHLEPTAIPASPAVLRSGPSASPPNYTSDHVPAPQLLASTAAPRHPSQPPLLPAVASNWSPSSASPPLPPPIHFPRGPVRSWNPKI